MLWDFSHEDYNKKELKKHIWESVTRDIVPNFNELDMYSRSQKIQKVQLRWKSLRDCFVKEKKNNSKNSKRQYLYTELLEFLNPFSPRLRKSGKRRKLSRRQIQKIKQDQQAVVSSPLCVAETAEREPLVTKFKKIGSSMEASIVKQNNNDKDSSPHDHRSSNANNTNNTSNSNNINNGVIKNDDERPIEITAFSLAPSASVVDQIAVNNSSVNEEIMKLFSHRDWEDEDRAFFTSLLPTVRLLNTDQKLWFRSEVLQILMNIKTSNHSGPHQS